MTPVSLLVIGAGNRGTGYARYALQRPAEARIVGVAEPRRFFRERIADDHDLPGDRVVEDWRALAEQPRMADAAIITTQDAMHVEPAIAFAKRGYHIMLEKPMAPTAEDCRRIVAAVKRNGVMLAVCHVMRYTRYTRRLKALLDSGRIGEIISVQHLEPVGYWHQAHSYVRGNWRNEAESSPMLLAKSCHDLDWLRHIVGRRCLRVSSFGSLTHFRAAERPAGAADRCLDCAVEAECPYSARRIYTGFLERGRTGWPIEVLTHDTTREGLMEALRSGPYGRCVYACDNDVVDHQVVTMEFEGGATAAFTMTAFTRARDRETRIFGSRGEIYGNGSIIEVYDFLTDQTETIATDADSDGSILTGHGGGDGGLMQAFVRALAENDPASILSGPDETLESHLMVFAAEDARRDGRVADVTL